MSSSSSSSSSFSSSSEEYQPYRKLARTRHSNDESRYTIILSREQYFKVMQSLSKDTPPPRDTIIISLTRSEISYIQKILHDLD
jgi:hypothetical protein